MHVTGLFIYPVKSLRGISVERAELDPLGFVGDRRFLVVDVDGRFITQRTVPRMALVETALTPTSLILSSAGAGQIQVPRPSDSTAPLKTVSVWSSEGLEAEDCGDAVATWLENILALKCRLVRAGARFHRPFAKPGKARPGEVLGFVDAYPLLAISEASLVHLNDRLVARREEAVPMDRFRPNIVVTGCDAFAEDSWPRVRMGQVQLRAGGPCARCSVTTVDQQTAERGHEPLQTLAMFRRDAVKSTDVNFGQNFIHETKSGSIAIGAPVQPLST